MQSMEDWESGNVTTSGGGLECVCSVFLPDITFPADRVHHMQQVTTDLRLEVEIQMNKVSIKQHPLCFLMLFGIFKLVLQLKKYTITIN